MTSVPPVLHRAMARPWVAAAVVAALFVGAQGVWSAVSPIFFLPDGLSLSFLWELIRPDWGVRVAYVGVLAAALLLLRQGARAGIVHTGWPLVWRAAVAYLPVSVVIDFCLWCAVAVARDRPFHFLGLELFS